MFAIANPDASHFQRASGRARQARLRLLRQHGWALSARRRSAARLRDPEGRAVSTRQRPFADGYTRAAVPSGDPYPGAADVAPCVRPEPIPVSLNFFY